MNDYLSTGTGSELCGYHQTCPLCHGTVSYRPTELDYNWWWCRDCSTQFTAAELLELLNYSELSINRKG